MRTMLFCTAYFNNMQRYIDWATYYSANMEKLGVEHIFMIDDGSENLSDALYEMDKFPFITVLSFPTHLGRPAHTLNEGWLRSFLFSHVVAEKYGFDKIIDIESDYYLFNFEKLRRIESGWNTGWCSINQFPETAIQVICKDKYDELKEMFDKGLNILNSKCVELQFIGKDVIRDLQGIRWEIGSTVPRNLGYDYIGQINELRQIKWYLPNDNS